MKLPLHLKMLATQSNPGCVGSFSNLGVQHLVIWEGPLEMLNATMSGEFEHLKESSCHGSCMINKRLPSQMQRRTPTDWRKHQRKIHSPIRQRDKGQDVQHQVMRRSHDIVRTLQSIQSVACNCMLIFCNVSQSREVRYLSNLSIYRMIAACVICSHALRLL